MLTLESVLRQANALFFTSQMTGWTEPDRKFDKLAVWLLDRNDLLTWSIRSQEEEPSAGRKRPLRQGAEVKADKATIIRWL